MRKLLVAVLFVLPALAVAATPSEGVPLKVRRGFFTETDIGTFFTVGGLNQYSNAQTYLQLGVGYDLSESLGLGVHFGLGSNAANCFSAINARGECATADNFTMTFIDVTAAYLIKIADRLYIAPKLAAGYTSMDPAPVLNATTNLGVSSGVNVGGGVGIEYATYMDHFSVGADALVRFIAGPNITTIAIFPRVKYTF